MFHPSKFSAEAARLGYRRIQNNDESLPEVVNENQTSKMVIECSETTQKQPEPPMESNETFQFDMLEKIDIPSETLEPYQTPVVLNDSDIEFINEFLQ